MVDATDLTEAWTVFRVARRDYLSACAALAVQRKQARKHQPPTPFDLDFEAELDAADNEPAEDKIVVLTRVKFAAEDTLWAAVASLELMWIKYGLRGQSLSATSKG